MEERRKNLYTTVRPLCGPGSGEPSQESSPKKKAETGRVSLLLLQPG